MAKKAEKQTNTKFFNLFVGEYLSILLDHVAEKTVQNEKQIETLQAPLTVMGYLTEEDDDYFYLGYEQNTINQVVRKLHIVHIEATEETEEKVEMPEGEKPKRGSYN